jgi:heat shock protein HslJ
MKTFFFVILSFIATLGFSQKKAKEVWKLVQVRNGAKLYPVPSQDNEFGLSIKEKRFTGFIGCNRFSGRLEYAKGNYIRPMTLVSTKMGCPENLSSLEYATMEAIQLSDRLIIKGTKAEFYTHNRLMLQLEKLP